MRVYRSLRRRDRRERFPNPWRRPAGAWPVFPGRRRSAPEAAPVEADEVVPRVVQLARIRAIILSKRERAKARRLAKRALRLRRRELGAIGAGHLDGDEYKFALAFYFDVARLRRLRIEEGR